MAYLSTNKELSSEDKHKYKVSLRLSAILIFLGLIPIFLFDNGPIITSTVSGMLIVIAYLSYQQYQYRQYRDLKHSLVFIGLSIIMAVGLWVGFLFM